MTKIEDDHYDALGLTEEAEQKEIKKAYKLMALKYHPDKNSTPEAAAMFLKVKNAYQILTDEGKKGEYDSSLRSKKAKKRKEGEMDATRKKMKEDLVRRENEEKERKEGMRAAKAQKFSEDDMSWLKQHNKPFKVPKNQTPPPPVFTEEVQTTIQARWSRKKTFTREEVMEAFKKFGDIDLVVLTEFGPKQRPCALISFKDSGSAQAAINAGKVDSFKTKWPPKPTPSTPTPPPKPTHQTPQSPFTFTSPFGSAFPSPASSPFSFTSPFGTFGASAPSSRSAAELDDFEMQTLARLRKAAQAQKEQTPTSTPDKAPSNGVGATPTTTPIKTADSGKPSDPIDVDTTPNTTPNAKFNLNTPPSSKEPIDVDGGSGDFESLSAMNLRRAAERNKMMEDLKKADGL